MTGGGDGGDTYSRLSEAKLAEIKIKLSQKNSGKNNGQSKQIKCRSIITGEELLFDTVTDCLRHFGIKNKQFIYARASGKCNLLWRNEWQFAYQCDDYADCVAYDPSTRKGLKLKLIDSSGTEHVFNSKNKAIAFISSSKHTFNKDLVKLGYQIIYL